MKSPETGEWAFPSEAEVYFLLECYVGSEFLCLPLLCYSLFCFLPFCCETLKFLFSILLFNAALIERAQRY